MALDWFDQFALRQLDRIDALGDQAVKRAATATRAAVQPQLEAQGDILLSGVVMGGIDEQASLQCVDRASLKGLRQQAKRRPRLDELDEDGENR